MLRHGLAVAVLLAGSTVLATPARADDPVRSEAVEHFEAEQYALAAGAFAASFVRSRDPADLFAWAQSERLLGSCERAVALYSLFLSSSPPAPNRAAASRGIELCKGEIELTLTRPEMLATEPGRSLLAQLMERGYALTGNAWFLYARAEAEPAAQRCRMARSLLDRSATEARSPLLEELARARLNECGRPAEPMRPRWYRDLWGGALTGGGLASAVAGGILLYVGNRRVNDADRSTYGDFAADVSSGRRFRMFGVVAIGAGAVLGALGLWRYTVVRGRVRVVPRLEGERVGITLSTVFW